MQNQTKKPNQKQANSKSQKYFDYKSNFNFSVGNFIDPIINSRFDFANAYSFTKDVVINFAASLATLSFLCHMIQDNLIKNNSFQEYPVAFQAGLGAGNSVNANRSSYSKEYYHRSVDVGNIHSVTRALSDSGLRKSEIDSLKKFLLAKLPEFDSNTLDIHQDIYVNNQSSIKRLKKIVLSNKYYSCEVNFRIQKGVLKYDINWLKTSNKYKVSVNLDEKSSSSLSKKLAILPAYVSKNVQDLIRNYKINTKASGVLDIVFSSPNSQSKNYKTELVYFRPAKSSQEETHLKADGVVMLNGKYYYAAEKKVVKTLTTYENVTIQVPDLMGQRIQYPIKNARISSRYGYRTRPRKAFHAGIDFAAPVGTNIMAAAPGKILMNTVMSGYGKLTVVSHGSFTTVYAHLSKFCKNVGDKVEAGDVIAKVGMTGRTTGPHLHFELRIKNKHTNPEHYLIKNVSNKPKVIKKKVIKKVDVVEKPIGKIVDFRDVLLSAKSDKVI